MESPSLRLAETSEQKGIHQNAIRELLVLVPKGAFCFFDAKGSSDKRSGIFADTLISTIELEIYHRENLPFPTSSLRDAVAAVHRSMHYEHCPIPTDVIAQTQKAKGDLEKKRADLKAQFATPVEGHFFDSEIDATGLMLKHTQSTPHRYAHGKRNVHVTITAAIGPILYWVQQNQAALNEYLATGVMPSLEKQIEYRLRSFKVELLALSQLIKIGLLQHGVDLDQVPLLDTTLTFQRADVKCVGRSGKDYIHCMIDEWLQCLTRIVELEPDFLPKEWQEPFLISRGKVVKPKAPEVGYRDLATPNPGRVNLNYRTTIFYGVHILRWTLLPQNRHFFEQPSGEMTVLPLSEPKSSVVRTLIARLFNL
jgi:hypothetical protein